MKHGFSIEERGSTAWTLALDYGTIPEMAFKSAIFTRRERTQIESGVGVKDKGKGRKLHELNRQRCIAYLAKEFLIFSDFEVDEAGGSISYHTISYHTSSYHIIMHRWG